MATAAECDRAGVHAVTTSRATTGRPGQYTPQQSVKQTVREPQPAAEVEFVWALCISEWLQTMLYGV